LKKIEGQGLKKELKEITQFIFLKIKNEIQYKRLYKVFRGLWFYWTNY